MAPQPPPDSGFNVDKGASFHWQAVRPDSRSPRTDDQLIDDLDDIFDRDLNYPEEV